SMHVVVILVLLTLCQGRKIEDLERRNKGSSYTVNKTITHYVNNVGEDERSSPRTSIEEESVQRAIFDSLASNEWRSYRYGIVTPARILDASLPFLVNDLAYFWGEESLPANVSGCIHIHTANLKGNFKYCDVDKKLRCSKFASVKYYSFLPAKDTRQLRDGRRQLAWFCPALSRCCEWECCIDNEVQETIYEEDEDVRAPIRNLYGVLFTAFFITVFALFVCIFSLIFYNSCERSSRRMESVERTPPQGDFELSPRPSESPRQGVRYGWNVECNSHTDDAPPPYVPKEEYDSIFLKQNEENERLDRQNISNYAR
ncbi:hypothetical protein PMAYCL1PPCAC_06214, partial [Pristionchus mayeri]